MIGACARRTAGSLVFVGMMAQPMFAARQVETQAPPSRQRPVTGQPTEPTAPVVVADQDAHATRERLRNLFERQPPTLARVLRADPSLLSNQAYLAPYPAVAAFIAQHPEIARNPAFFLDFVPRLTDPLNPQRELQRDVINMWGNMAESVTIFFVFVLVTAAFIWLIRTFIDYRRWSRLSKVQAEVHNKLLDRFASNQELLSYIQTPAGRRFLESAPITLDNGGKGISAPFGRILWSIQAGLVLGAGGIGLLFVRHRVIEEVGQPLFVLGSLALAVGLGFVISAVVSFVLSRKLGLFEAAAAGRTAASESSR